MGVNVEMLAAVWVQRSFLTPFWQPQRPRHSAFQVAERVDCDLSLWCAIVVFFCHNCREGSRLLSLAFCSALSQFPQMPKVRPSLSSAAQRACRVQHSGDRSRWRHGAVQGAAQGTGGVRWGGDYQRGSGGGVTFELLQGILATSLLIFELSDEILRTFLTLK